jgi:hypothetical protein
MTRFRFWLILMTRLLKANHLSAINSRCRFAGEQNTKSNGNTLRNALAVSPLSSLLLGQEYVTTSLGLCVIRERHRCDL